jgi:hypothetical protein
MGWFQMVLMVAGVAPWDGCCVRPAYVLATKADYSGAGRAIYFL